MYPRISDLINDFLGTDINLPVQTYGFFMALAFIFGGWVIYSELKRKEKEGSSFPQKRSGSRENRHHSDAGSNAVIGFVMVIS